MVISKNELTSKNHNQDSCRLLIYFPSFGITMQDRSKKRILVTGGTSGLGLELVKLFLDDGSEVYATGRNYPVSLSDDKPGFHFIQVDFSDLGQVRSVIKKVLSSGTGFDLVVNCAGVLTPPVYTATIDGFEYSFQVNFLAHLMIGDLIVDSLEAQKTLGMVSVTSPVYKYIEPGFKWPEKKGYRPFRVYCESKYYMLFTGNYLKKIHEGKDLFVFSLDPGIFSSGIYRMQKGWFRRMYKIAAPFMRSSHNVARNLHGILIGDGLIEDRIYKHSCRRSIPSPPMNEGLWKFMAACHEELKKRY